MNAFVVKGKPGRNDLRAMLRPRTVGRWVTRRPARGWLAGDRIFVWEGAPTLAIVGVAVLDRVMAPDSSGVTAFYLRYETAYLEAPVGIDRLRADRTFADASFLRAGAAGTVFPITERQAARISELVSPVPPNRDFARALSIRQPWAELILRGDKTVECRSRPTNVRGKVYVYASYGDVDPEHQVRVADDHGIDIEALPRGVIVGTVEIVGCRPLRGADSRAASIRIPRETEDYGWLLANPRRLARPRRPKKHPQPVFFRPF